MEYKFKTIHEGKLVECFVVKDEVFLEVSDLHYFNSAERSCLYFRKHLKDAPIFAYIGRNDKNDEEVYTGHRLSFNIGNQRSTGTVTWDQAHYRYCLTDIKIVTKIYPFLITFEAADINKLEQSEIIGHLGIERVK